MPLFTLILWTNVSSKESTLSERLPVEPDAVLNRLLQLEELTQTQQQQLEQIASLTRQDSK